MARYIDADKALEVWKENDFIKLVGQERTAKTVLDVLPSEDVAPVIHSNWTIREVPKFVDRTGFLDCVCNNCNRQGFAHTAYCPYCGAKMGEEVLEC